ncbi:hypothetical protein IE53DRAFT_385943 [Violaceomyces palustris]|uniref:Uncharacterized protein n=1 Tax=Violaceomyces palustris TaxID=1673888 RepID=A0ACD0P104_9BASI|nr:hypothetical protein IE53DRAFT_385943 [Violaceomyces palustris]
MPRRRKGLKREKSDSAQPNQTSSIPKSNFSRTHSLNSIELARREPIALKRFESDQTLPSLQKQQQQNRSTFQQRLQPPPSRSTSSSTNWSKRQRILSEDEEERLGRLCKVDVWLEKVKQGRGAAACILGFVLGHRSNLSDRSITLDLSSTSSDDRQVNLQLKVIGPNAASLQVYLQSAGVLDRNDRTGLVPSCYVSGFGGTLAFDSQDASDVPIVDYDQGRIAIKLASGESTSEDAWFERTEHEAEANQAAPERRQSPFHPGDPTAADPSIVGPSRFVPARTLPLPRHPPQRPTTSPPLQLPAQAQASAPAHPSSAAAERPASPRPPSSITSDWFTTPAPPLAAHQNHVATPPMKEEAEAAPQQSSEARLACEGEPSTKTRSNKRAKSAKRGPDPFKPVVYGQCEYTPIALARNGMKANFIGVVLSISNPRRVSGGSRDWHVKLSLADRSCVGKHQPHGAIQAGTAISINLFTAVEEQLPYPVAVGQVVLLRKINIQTFVGKEQGVGKRDSHVQWAIYNEDPALFRKSESLRGVSLNENNHMRDLAAWYAEISEGDKEIAPRPTRSTLLLSEISENLFFDCVVEVVKVFAHSFSPDVYVTDYTSHPLFYRGNDQHLHLEGNLRYPDEGDGGGSVFQIGLWASHAELAEALRVGDIIRLQNVRAKMNPLGKLVGGLGSNSDSGCKIRTLKPGDENRAALEKRKDEFKERIFEMEEEAFAEEAELAAMSETLLRADGDEAVQVGRLERGKAASSADAAGLGVGDPNPSRMGKENEGPSSERPEANQLKREEPSFSSSFVRMTGEMSLPPPGQGQAAPLKSVQPPGERTSESRPQSSNGSMHGNEGEGEGCTRRAALTSTDEMPAKLPERPTTSSASNVSHHPPKRCRSGFPYQVKCTYSHLPITRLEHLVKTSQVPAKYHIRAKVVDVNPPCLSDWARVECRACDSLLPLDESFCKVCADEEGEDLEYILRFALLVKDCVDAEGSGPKIPIVVSHDAAMELFPGVDAEKVHKGLKGLNKLRRRAACLIGLKLAFRETGFVPTLKDLGLAAGEGEGEGERERKEGGAEDSDGIEGPIFDAAINSYEIGESKKAGKVVRRFGLLPGLTKLVPIS